MKFIVEQSALADCVNWVSRSLSTRPIKTELLGIVIDATGSNVELSGSDLETSSKANFPAQIVEAGKVLVPGKLLVEITRSLPNKPITITLDGTRVLVTSGSAKFTLPTLSINEYPNLPELPESTGVIASDTFATAVAQVAIAAGRDDSLPTLTTTSKNVSLSLGSASSNDRLAGFAGEAKTMTSRMLDGTFPPYRHLLPQEITTTAVVEVAPFLDSVRRVALVTDKTVPLRLEFTNGSLSLEAGAGEEAQATESIEIWEGKANFPPSSKILASVASQTSKSGTPFLISFCP